MSEEEIEKIADLVVKKIKEEESVQNDFRKTERIKVEDMMFYSLSKKNNLFYIENKKYANYFFIRGVATNFLFEAIDFSKTIFDGCYFKNCRFVRCSFEGAKFKDSNLQGSYFQDCIFDYATFEKTYIDFEVFECAPDKDNLKYRFARSLKLNYASIGDHIKASKAIYIELEATKKHLKDSWMLPDSWYRNKYGSIKHRIEQFKKWVEVSLLDFVWGNGENWMRLVKANFYVFSVLSIWDVVSNYEEYRTHDFPSSVGHYLCVLFIKIPSNYFGIEVLKEKVINNVTTTIDYFSYYPEWLSLLLVILRMICFGLLMSIIIKKYNRR